MMERLYDIICCPVCLKKVVKKSEVTLVCEDCGFEYEIKNNVPILLSKDRKKEIQNAIAGWKSSEIIPPIPWWMIKISKSPNIVKWGGEISLVNKIVQENAIVLDIGCGANLLADSVISLDITLSPQTKVVGDANELPFLSESIDAVTIFRVLEHTKTPYDVVKQIFRVLKKRGRVYAIIPFLEPFHLNPTDNVRFCRDGILNLFSDFECKKLELIAGPGTTLSWILREYLAIAFPFSNNKWIYVAVREIMGWILYPLKITDIFLRNKIFAHKIGCEFLYIGEKR